MRFYVKLVACLAIVSGVIVHAAQAPAPVAASAVKEAGAVVAAQRTQQRLLLQRPMPVTAG